jgi:putative oxidoreductase
MKIIIAIPRILLGLAFVVLPSLAIFHQGSRPPAPTGPGAFVGALKQTGYMLPLVWGTEIVSGFLILVGLFVPFALVLLAPVLVNIFLFHAFLAPSPNGLATAIILGVLALVVAWQYRKAFAPLFVSGNPN